MPWRSKTNGPIRGGGSCATTGQATDITSTAMHNARCKTRRERRDILSFACCIEPILLERVSQPLLQAADDDASSDLARAAGGLVGRRALGLVVDRVRRERVTDGATSRPDTVETEVLAIDPIAVRTHERRVVRLSREIAPHIRE